MQKVFLDEERDRYTRVEAVLGTVATSTTPSSPTSSECITPAANWISSPGPKLYSLSSVTILIFPVTTIASASCGWLWDFLIYLAGSVYI